MALFSDSASLNQSDVNIAQEAIASILSGQGEVLVVVKNAVFTLGVQCVSHVIVSLIGASGFDSANSSQTIQLRTNRSAGQNVHLDLLFAASSAVTTLSKSALHLILCS